MPRWCKPAHTGWNSSTAICWLCCSWGVCLQTAVQYFPTSFAFCSTSTKPLGHSPVCSPTFCCSPFSWCQGPPASDSLSWCAIQNPLLLSQVPSSPESFLVNISATHNNRYYPTTICSQPFPPYWNLQDCDKAPLLLTFACKFSLFCSLLQEQQKSTILGDRQNLALLAMKDIKGKHDKLHF